MLWTLETDSLFIERLTSWRVSSEASRSPSTELQQWRQRPNSPPSPPLTNNQSSACSLTEKQGDCSVREIQKSWEGIWLKGSNENNTQYYGPSSGNAFVGRMASFGLIPQFCVGSRCEHPIAVSNSKCRMVCYRIPKQPKILRVPQTPRGGISQSLLADLSLPNANSMRGGSQKRIWIALVRFT